VPKKQPNDKPERPTDTRKEPQLSADEGREILRTLKPMKAEDRLPEGKTIVRFISRLKPRKRR
jgi:hypothetical protein